MENVEVWKDVVGYDGKYQVSCLGRIKSLYKRRSSRILSQKNDRDGYLSICLCKNNMKKHFRTHRLVCDSFIENPSSLPVVNHINGIKNDNRVENLEWTSVLENIRHSWKTGLSNRKIGENNFHSKLTEKIVLEIRSSSLSRKELANTYKVSPELIGLVINRKSWIHI